MQLENPTAIEEAAIDLAADYYPDVFSERISEGRFVPYAYQRLMLRTASEAVWNGGGRIIINAPSRHGKSTPISQWLPIWFLNTFPEKSIILASYGQSLASEWGRKVRNEFLTNRNLSVRISEDSQAANRWHTEADGEMVAAGMDGPIVGKGGHLIVVDDPHKSREEAQSPVVREAAIDWYNGTLLSRQEPGATIVIIQQRMHEQDLTGWLIEHHAESWKVIRLPALAEEGDILGRPVGESLCPQRYSREALLSWKKEMDISAWEAMFQQRPEGHGPGRLYFPFVASDHIHRDIALRNDLPLQLDFDFNRNPGMHIEVGQYDTIRDVLNCRHEIHGPYMKLAPALDAVTALIQSLGGWKWPSLEIYGDATGTQERAETTQTAYEMVTAWVGRIRDIFKKPIPVRMCVPAANPPVRTRIETFNNCLRDTAGDIHFAVHPDCTRLIADLKSMREDEQGLEDKRDAKLSHASSATGYRICWCRPLKPKASARVIDVGNFDRTFR